MPWEIPKFCECRYPDSHGSEWCLHCHRPLHQSPRDYRKADDIRRRVANKPFHVGAPKRSGG